MTRRLIVTAITLAALLVAFASGAWTAMVRGWGAPTATIDVLNSASRRIQSIELQIDTCARHTILLETWPPDSRSQRYKVPVCGEGGYRLKVEFADGPALSTQGGYIESGYRVTETVGESAITSKVDPIAY